MERANVEKLPGYEQLSGSNSALPTMLVQTPRGQVKMHDVPGITSMLVEKEDRCVVGLALYNVGSDPNETGVGFITQMSPENARKMAASLIRIADMVEAKD